MRHQTAPKMFGLVLALGIVVPAHSQGVYWETVASGGPGGAKERISTVYHMPGRLKSVEANGETTIMLIDKRVIYTLDPKKMTYSEMTFDELEGAMKEVSAMMSEKTAEMQKEMEGMSDDERKMVEQMMKGKMPGSMTAGPAKEAKMDAKRTGKRETIAGRECTEIVVTEDGKEYLKAWATKDVKAFDGMKNDMEEFRKLMSSLNPMIPKGHAEAMRKIEGFPMIVEMKNGMKQEVRKIETGAIDDGEFEIPADYKKVDSDLNDRIGR